MDGRQIEQVRSFNRAVTQRIGALNENYLARGRPLGEARLIFEIGLAGGSDLSVLRQRLGLDSGYMSRLLRSLEKQGIIEVSKAPGDGRARRVLIAAKGLSEYAAYDALSNDLADSILAPLDADQRARLVSAMAEVERLIGRIDVAMERPDSADGYWCLQQYYAELAERFESGFDPMQGFDPSEMAPPAGFFVVARRGEEPVGCGGLKHLGQGVGEIKRVWTASTARGRGIASRMLDKLEEIARENNLTALRLDTNRSLTEAHALYRKRGYREIPRYNDNPYADHWFEKRL